MHVYLRDEPVVLRMERVDGDGLLPEGSDLVAMAFYAADNEQPSFRALLPPETVLTLREALTIPVILGVLAEEPEEETGEIRAMVGMAVPLSDSDAAHVEEEGEEPWKVSSGVSDAWRGDEGDGYEDPQVPRTALLAFAPLVRIQRRFPDDFAAELADLLETALAGVTRPALEARVDRMLDDL